MLEQHSHFELHKLAVKKNQPAGCNTSEFFWTKGNGLWSNWPAHIICCRRPFFLSSCSVFLAGPEGHPRKFRVWQTLRLHHPIPPLLAGPITNHMCLLGLPGGTGGMCHRWCWPWNTSLPMLLIRTVCVDVSVCVRRKCVSVCWGGRAVPLTQSFIMSVKFALCQNFSFWKF